MPSVIERLNANVNTGALDQGLAEQVGALQKAIALAGPIIEGKTPDIGTLVGSLGALRGPAFSAGGGFGAAIGKAASLVPADLESIVAPVGGRFADMATLVDERLKPLLQDAVKSAQAIQQLLNLRLGCIDGVAGAKPAPAPPPAAPGPGAPAPAAPPGRVAVAAQQLAQFDAALNVLPATIDAGVLLQMLLALLGTKSREKFATLNLPFVDDMIDPLQTLAAWAAMDAAGVEANMVASVDTLSARLRGSASQPLADLAVRLNPLAPLWRRAALAAASDAVANGLAALDAALQAADGPATASALTALNTALDDYDALRVTLSGDVLAAVPALRDRFALVPADLFDGVLHLLIMLESTNVAARVTSQIAPFEPVPPEAIQSVRDTIHPLIDWLRDLVGLLDLGSVQDEIGEVATVARTLAADIESEMTGVAIKVQSAFAEVSEAIAGIGLDDLRNQLTGQIAQFGEQIQNDVAQAFAPARQGTTAAIGAVSGALDDFDPEALVDALQQVVDGIAGVLNGPEVKAAIDEVRHAVDAVVDALKSLSFAPVTDEVVALIGEMQKGLKAVIDKDLNDATKTALGAAMSVLPGDLHPVTDPLLADFDQLVAEGPIAVLASVKDAPKRLLDEVKRFEPAALIGDRLSAPYRELLAKADRFKAAQLFAAADAELEKTRRRLLQVASPSRALQPLGAPLQQLFAKLDAFTPSTLLAPLTQAVKDTIARIVDASPVDEVLGAINGVFDAVRDVLDFAKRIQSVVTRINQVFEALTDSDRQLDAWRDGILAKAGGAGAPLQTALTGLNAALDSIRHADVLAAFDAAIAAGLTELVALDPAARLARIVAAYGRLATRVPTLPPSAAKDAAQAVLNRFNPTQPLHSAPLRLAGDLRNAMTSARSSLVALTDDWTETADGFANLRNVAAGSVRDLLKSEIDNALHPVRYVFKTLGNVAAPLDGVTQTVNELVTTLTARVDALINGPASLSAISGAVQQVVDALRNIDLSFVGRSLDDVLKTVRDQLRALDPTALGGDLDKAFQQALSGLSLSAVIPPGDIAALDAAWHGVVEKLRGLDPGKLVEDALQPVYDEAVLPLLDAFDLTPVFAALIEFLESLKGELGSGLDEVNGAYQSLLALRPGGGASASIGA